jgi:pyrimidine operon attenuation protein/uracil phosphoribosyltransferase
MYTLTIMSSNVPDSVPDAEALYATLLAQLRAELQGKEVVLVGIATGGAWVAERLHADLRIGSPLGVVTSTLHRDDYATKGVASGAKTRLPFAVDGRDIWLIDDVLHTGRTIRAALNELFDFGRPRHVRLAVLVDRGGRELPVSADIAATQVALKPDTRLSLSRSLDQESRVRFIFTLHAHAQ